MPPVLSTDTTTRKPSRQLCRPPFSERKVLELVSEVKRALQIFANFEHAFPTMESPALHDLARTALNHHHRVKHMLRELVAAGGSSTLRRSTATLPDVISILERMILVTASAGVKISTYRRSAYATEVSTAARLFTHTEIDPRNCPALALFYAEEAWDSGIEIGAARLCNFFRARPSTDIRSLRRDLLSALNLIREERTNLVHQRAEERFVLLAGRALQYLPRS
jgi:hypothetical protein